MAITVGMPRLPRRQRILLSVPLTFLTISILWFLLPSDSNIGLAIRFNINRALILLTLAGHQDDWLEQRAMFPVDLDNDVALVIKTGFGTVDRLEAQLTALGIKGKGENLLVVADFGTKIERGGETLVVHDAIGEMLERRQIPENSERVEKYRQLTEAIASADKKKAMDIGKQFGWELDAMKFISSLERIYEKLPDKKWYIMIDDDTYLIEPTLKLLLDHLNPTAPQYIGNAVGDFRKRFAHGGSGYFISQAAMHQLFVQNPQVVKAAHVQSLTEKWGDRLIAATLIKAGVYLDERYSHYFNGESPLATRIRTEKYCSPIVSFHKLNKPEQMEEVGKIFSKKTSPITWADVWQIYSGHNLEAVLAEQARPGHDHVGTQSDRKFSGIDSPQQCQDMCTRQRRTCMAWTWRNDNTCRLAPWFIVGTEEERNSISSGLNVENAKRLIGNCENKPWTS